MRVAVVYSERNKGELAEMAEALAHAIGNEGHSVTVINALLEGDTRLSIYEYIIFGTAPLSLFSNKLDTTLENFIKSSGSLSGKRCYVFVKKKGLRSYSLLSALMELVEREGVFLKTSDVINSKNEASYIGKKLRISK